MSHIRNIPSGSRSDVPNKKGIPMSMRFALTGFCVLLTASSCAPIYRLDGHVSAVAAGAQENWLTPGGDTDETHYSRLDAITPKNIGRLGLSWSLDLPGETALAGTPLAVDGVLYFTGDYAVIYAVDAASGKLLWKYDPELWKDNPAAV